MTPTPPFELSSPIPTYDTCIVDGSYLIHRILYASGSKGEPPFSEMMTSMGEPTGAIYGCLKTLRASINLPDFIAKDLVIVWDGRPAGLSKRRQSVYPKYKVHEPNLKATEQDIANSKRHRNLLEIQRPKLIQVLNLLGVPSIDIPYREGDDLIACVTRTLSGSVVIMSDDKDFYQLISDRVHIYRAGIPNPHLVNLENFEKKIKIKTPSQYLLFAAIMGDGSDCIDGIQDVGPATAERVANASVFDGWVSLPVIETTIKDIIADEPKKANRTRFQKLLDNVSVVSRNIELMDLRLETWNVSERTAFEQSYQMPRVVCERELIAEFDRLEFKSYLKDFSDWILPFRKLCRREVVPA